jgi:hypothetical protein
MQSVSIQHPCARLCFVIPEIVWLHPCILNAVIKPHDLRNDEAQTRPWVLVYSWTDLTKASSIEYVLGVRSDQSLEETNRASVNKENKENTSFCFPKEILLG